jgi:uncharacterized protein YegP (UPF0339 family)
MSKVKYHIEVFQGKDNQWYWRLQSVNGQILLASEGYTRKEAAVEASSNLKNTMSNVSYQILD